MMGGSGDDRPILAPKETQLEGRPRLITGSVRDWNTAQKWGLRETAKLERSKYQLWSTSRKAPSGQ